MRTMSMTIAASVAILWFVVVPSTFALTLDDAKAQGLVGEKTTGYLGLINSSNAEARALVEDVNQKRRQAYDEIAKRNRTELRSVETLAGEKAIQNTKPGNYIEGPGGWVKK
ncbi:MAG: YdbL family protein [Nitrospira sp.]